MRNLYPKRLGFLLATLLAFGIVSAQDTSYQNYRYLLTKNFAQLGINAKDIQNAIITNAYTDASSQITFVYVQQAYQQIKVYNTIISAAFRNGTFLYTSGTFVNDIESKVVTTVPAKSYLEATKAAATHLGVPETGNFSMVKDLFDEEKKYIVTPGGIARRDIEATLYFVASDDKQKVALAWNINIDMLNSPDWWNVRIDAATGEFLEKDNWTVSEANGVEFHLGDRNKTVPSTDLPPVATFVKQPHKQGPSVPPLYPNAPPATVTSASYRVIPYPIESPNFGSPATVNNPWLLAGAGNNATTNGWHFDGTTNYNTTRGNNVFAFLDITANNTSNATTNWPDTSTTANPALTFVNNPIFTQQPISSANNTNKKFALDNLFYWNNIMHDVYYQYGLDEQSGAFQADNLSRGGVGNDYVQANAMDQAGYANANFNTPVDGLSGRMQMYLWFGNTPLTINAPENIAGTYQGLEASFVTTVSNKLIALDPKTDTVVLYNDNAAGTVHSACVAPVNAAAVKGNIALIDFFGGSGSCTTYSFKVRTAQTAGATAVIVYSSTSTVPSVGGGDANAAGITIPVIGVSNTVATAMINQMNLGNTVVVTMESGIYLDGDLDNGIIAHEYGHGISNRLTGGPSNSSCLSNSEQGGEGWSDYMSLMVTTNWATAQLTDGPKPRPIGTYALNQAASGTPGIRRYPYSTNLAVHPLTYANLPTSVIPHGVGEIWCATIWDMTWNIIQQQGSITADIYNSAGTGGNVIALNLVTLGMKLQPCGPGFLDARNAILAADSILYGYAHKCAIWNAFARRGMGFSASQGSASNITDQVTATDLPVVLQVPRPFPQIVSTNSTTTFTHTATCGCGAINNFVLRDTIPTGFSFISSNPVGSLNGNVLSFPATSFAQNETKNFAITLKAPATGCLVDTVINDNRETSTTGSFVSSGSPGWTTSTVRPHTSTSSWFVSNPASTGSSSLTSGNTAATAAQNLSVLSFWHYFNTENNFDGGVLEYSTDGTTWLDAGPLFLSNTYNNANMVASSALAGRKAFSGSNLVYSPSLLNLTSFGSSNVMFRFRMVSDNGVGSIGWFVDDITRTNGCGGILKTGLYNSAAARQDTLMQPIFVTTSSPLPLTLLWFYATQVDGQVALDWKTASEVNVKDFTVEWSIDGNTWLTIASKTATNRNTNSYSFLHTTPVKGNNFYRIRMNDVDGHYTYAPVRIINLKEEGKPMLVLLPNPVSSDAILFISKDIQAKTVKIFNAAGSLVRQIAVGTGTQQLRISTAELAVGVYTIETTGSGRHVTRMLVQR